MPTVVTFSPHPREVITGQPVPLLTTLDERADLLEALGVERFVVLPFSRALSQLEPEAYVEDVLLGKVGMREIVVGYDHRFGRGRAGDRETLEQIGARPRLLRGRHPRADLRGGRGRRGRRAGARRHDLVSRGTPAAARGRRCPGAALLLGRPYRSPGPVVKGDQRGRTIGFPTANVQPSSPAKLVPKTGVYAVRVRLRSGASRAA